MLSFLDSLCMALTNRDAAAITQLLAHPLAATLPPAVRTEAAALAADPSNGTRTPLHAFVFAHRMAQLMAAVGTPPGQAAPAPREATREAMPERLGSADLARRRGHAAAA